MATVNVYGELNCATTDGKLARADQIYDYEQGRKQSDINRMAGVQAKGAVADPSELETVSVNVGDAYWVGKEFWVYVATGGNELNGTWLNKGELKGVGIVSISEVASTESGGTNYITIQMSDGIEYEFEVLNGVNTATGSAFCYAADTSGQSSWDTGKNYLVPTSTTNEFTMYYNNGTSWVSAGTVTLNVDVAASGITYDPSDSSMEATNVQDAIDAIDEEMSVEEEYTKYTSTGGFVSGYYWANNGWVTISNIFSGYPNLIEVKKGDVIDLKNYRVYTPASGGGQAMTIYPTSAGTGGTRINGNSLTSLGSYHYTYTMESDGYLGVNIGTRTPSYLTVCVITVISKRKVSRLDGIESDIDAAEAQIAVNSQLAPKMIDSKQVDLIVFMGQSNMAGRGVVNSTHTEDAPEMIEGAGYEFRAVTDPTQLYAVTKLFGSTENVTNAIDDGSLKTGGCVPAFVNEYYKQTGYPVIGLSASDGGTALNAWAVGSARLNDALSRISTCVNWLEESGYHICNKYVAWCQGESDGDTGKAVATYKSQFLAIWEALKDAGMKACLMIRIGEYNGTTTSKITGYQNIQQAQDELCAENDDIVMVGTSLNLFKARSMMKDEYHFYQDAYNIMGREAGRKSGYYRNISNL